MGRRGRRDERGAGGGASATTVAGSRWEQSGQGWTRGGGGVNGQLSSLVLSGGNIGDGVAIALVKRGVWYWR